MKLHNAQGLSYSTGNLAALKPTEIRQQHPSALYVTKPKKPRVRRSPDSCSSVLVAVRSCWHIWHAETFPLESRGAPGGQTGGHLT